MNKKNNRSDIRQCTNSIALNFLIVILVSMMLIACGSNENNTAGLQQIKNSPSSREAQISIFNDELYGTLVKRCGHCHAGALDEPPETPDFAHQDVANAYSVIVTESLVDFDNSRDSLLVQKLLNQHNCTVLSCLKWAGEIQDGVENWGDKLFESSEVDVSDGTNPEQTDGVDDADSTNTQDDINVVTGTGEVIEVNEEENKLQITAFTNNLHPILTMRCGFCHAGKQGEPAGTPDFAQADAASAYSVVVTNTLVNLSNAANSRLVKKILSLHKCTQPTCDEWADEIKAGITGWANDVSGIKGGPGTTGTTIASKPLLIAEGIKDEGKGRIENNIIAKYEFKTGTGNIAFDSSGVIPALDLTLSENVIWLPGRGINITDPDATEVTKAVGTPAASRKLFNKIAGPGGSEQYTIETWLINDNTALDGPARIVSYSKDSQNRNFTMGQDTSYYNFRNRSDMTTMNGTDPTLESDNDAGDLKTQLQHVVFTFDKANGRNIFVNGYKVAYEGVEADPAVPADISNWNESYTFVLGNEAQDNVKRQWLGRLLFVAIHDKALTPEEIIHNTLEGIGDKYILDFDISSLLDATSRTNSIIRVTVSELDEYSYVFATPVLITDIPKPDIPLKNLQIAVNANVPAAAQTFRNIDISVTASDTTLSPLAAVIPKDLGIDLDKFSLTFEVLGNNTNVIIEANPVSVPDLSVNEMSPEFGVRTFAQINNTIAVLTGVDRTLANESYLQLEQQLPGTPYLSSFVSANQIGIAKLSLEYCDALVENEVLRTDFFGNTFDFSAPVSAAFDSEIKRDAVIDNLVSKMIGVNLTNQPSLAEVKPELNQLIDELSVNCNAVEDCDATRTSTIVKATCASVLASAAILID